MLVSWACLVLFWRDDRVPVCIRVQPVRHAIERYDYINNNDQHDRANRNSITKGR